MSKYALIIDDNKLVTESLKENIDWHKLDVVVTHVFYDALQIDCLLYTSDAADD